MRSVAILGLWALACGGAEAPARVSVPEAPIVAAPAGDPLLAKARASVDHGVLEPAVRASVLASTSPVHARAQALLAALDPAAPAVAPEVAAAPREPVAAPAESPAIVHDSTPDPPRTPVASVRPTVEKLSMRSTSAGASLSIQAGRGVLVGVANQPSAGVVRLVLDDVRAGAKVLSARPHVAGARVRDVDAGPSSVRITLVLDPGWRFAGVHRTKSGARVDLVGP